MPNPAPCSLPLLSKLGGGWGVPSGSPHPRRSCPLASLLAIRSPRRQRSWGEAALGFSSCSPWCSAARPAPLGSTSRWSPSASRRGLSLSRRCPGGGMPRPGGGGPFSTVALDRALHVAAWAPPSCSWAWVGGGDLRSILHRRRWLPPWLLARWRQRWLSAPSLLVVCCSVFPALSPLLLAASSALLLLPLCAVPLAATALVDYWLRSPLLDSCFCFLASSGSASSPRQSHLSCHQLLYSRNKGSQAKVYKIYFGISSI